jgi:hypothetical protein
MDYSVLIQTCDAYKACWEPFFKCFDKYWPEGKDNVYFANEGCKASLPHYVAQIKTGYGSWSDRLLRALKVMPDKPIFYMLEDFWITKEIDIRSYFELFERLDADSLKIVTRVGHLTTLSHVQDNLYHIDEKGKYILSLQPCFWKKEFLQSNLVKNEDPWQFETFGTDRLRRTGYKSKAYFADEDWYIGAYHRGKILPEGQKYLEEING